MVSHRHPLTYIRECNFSALLQTQHSFSHDVVSVHNPDAAVAQQGISQVK